jgi:hypothetical protein
MRGQQVATDVGVSAKRTVNATARAAMMEALEDRQLLSTYYVSPSGNDSRGGTSTSTAWKTISRVNKQTLHSGDKVLFQGGKSFSGGLLVNSNEGGVTFSTYGSGRATINSGGAQAIKVLNTAGITVSNLVMNGSGMSSNHLAGIYFQINSSGKKLSNVHISNVEIKNYGHEAIEFDINGKGGSSVSTSRSNTPTCTTTCGAASARRRRSTSRARTGRCSMSAPMTTRAPAA